MSTCADCRYCAPAEGGAGARFWPRPARWFDQPCVHCSHRLKAHDPGVPAGLDVPDLDAPLPAASPTG